MKDNMVSKMDILGTGLSGLVGSRIIELLSNEGYDFEDLSFDKGVDITKFDQVLKRFSKSKARIVLHLAAKTDVDGCEKDKEEDIKRLRNKEIKKFDGLNTAWAINVEGTRNVILAAKKTRKKVIYVSTDFVFDGVKGFYNEDDIPNPINWYGQTKYEGEKIVKESGLSFLICRIAYPYRAKFVPKKDFFRSILEKLKEGEKVFSLTDHIFTPTFIDDIAYAVKMLIKKQSSGIYHVVGDQFLTPFEAVTIIADKFGLDRKMVISAKMDEYYAGRAPRPLKLALKNDKIEKLGVKMSTLSEGLEKIKKYLILNN